MVKILKGFLACILVLLMVCMAYVHFNQDDLSAKVLGMLRSELATELEVGHFEVEMLTSFPWISLNLQDVKLKGKGGSELLDAGALKVTLSLFSIFSDQVRFRTLTLKDGSVYTEQLEDGTLSLEILKSSEGEGKSQALHFRRIALENVHLRYLDPHSNQDYALRFDHGEITGGFKNQVLDLEIDGDVVFDHVRLDKDIYLDDVKGAIAGTIILHFSERIYELENLMLRVGAQHYLVHGSIRSAEDHQHLDLEIHQTEGELGSFIALLPTGYRTTIPFTELRGEFIAEGFVRGRMNGKENPHVHFDLKVRGADMRSKSEMGVLREVDLNGSFDNGGARNFTSSRIDISMIEGKARGQHFNAAMHLSDFNDPVLTCGFEGSLPAEFVVDYLSIPGAKKASGTIHFNGIEVDRMRLSHANLTDIGDLHGKCILEDVAVHTASDIYKLRSGRLDLRADTLRIDGLEVETRHDKLSLHGWVSGLGDGLQSGDPAYFQYHISAEASRLNLSTWIPGLADAADQESHARPVTHQVSVPLRLPTGQLDLNAVQFRYADIQCDAVKAEIRTEKHIAHFDAFGHTSGGKVHAWGEVLTAQGYDLKLRLSGEDINMHECFEQCRNFGQSFIQSDHLHGKCNIKVIADVPWDLDGKLDQNAVHVFAGMAMTDGELVGFDMLEQFSSYVHAADLRHIKFDRIDNFIEVRDGNVFIPVMFIRSNAANLVVSGIHTLDNRILYNLKVNAGQVLTEKMKKHDALMQPLPARKEGTFNLFFTIAGTTEQFEYGMNKQGVESSFAQSEEMRYRIREELRKTFGETIDLIEPPEWETIPEYNLEVKGEDVFLEWED